MLLKRLSTVLLPFFLAWLIAYLLFPMVKFFQYRCRLKYRILGILCTFVTLGAVFAGLSFLIVPPMIEEVSLKVIKEIAKGKVKTKNLLNKIKKEN